MRYVLPAKPANRPARPPRACDDFPALLMDLSAPSTLRRSAVRLPRKN